MSDQHPDQLRTPETACAPDRRNLSFNLTLEDMHEAAKTLMLNGTVPEDVSVQFETSKNLYLYSWFVYRFYPVARLHALTVLELALRERFQHELPKNYLGFGGRPSLKSFIQYGKDIGILKNDAFESHRQGAYIRARTRHMYESIKYMSENNITELEYDENDIEITDEDRSFDTLAILQESLPAIRNSQAHGSSDLDHHAYSTLKTVSEIINQLWP